MEKDTKDSVAVWAERLQSFPPSSTNFILGCENFETGIDKLILTAGSFG